MKRNFTFSPIATRRLQAFRANRRGWWSLWIFVVILATAIASPLVANDKPLVMQLNGRLYFPVIKRYTEQEFGGQLPFQPDYRSAYMRQLVNKQQGWMLFPPIPYSYDTINYDLDQPAPSAPTTADLLGTDDQGRDVLARVIYGLRISLLFSIALTLVGVLSGLGIGAVQGYFGGTIDLLGQRFQEIWAGLPVLYILIILAGLVPPSFWWLLGVMSLFAWLGLVDVVRAEFLRGRSLEYVKAARALGLSDRKIIVRHILPNALTATVMFVPFIMTGSISTLSALDFLGFGMPAGSASLGELTLQSTQNLQAPWLAVAALLSIGGVLTLLVFIGEALRDAFDPRLA
ncbi:ABC transporter permease [Burkholderia pyrrocinia]|uniref:ABC transporter permease n=1 Tax=Burkholderia pyrrocinia TaxID=60550 RepID=UPI002AB26233|nr:ABC transporter permease [Burkholderia pyrrocinia]